MPVRIVIRDLPLYMTSQELRIIAQRYGAVRRCWVARDRRDKPLGFGYVEAVVPAEARAIASCVSAVVVDGGPCAAEVVEDLDGTEPWEEPEERTARQDGARQRRGGDQ